MKPKIFLKEILQIELKAKTWLIFICLFNLFLSRVFYINHHPIWVTLAINWVGDAVVTLSRLCGVFWPPPSRFCEGDLTEVSRRWGDLTPLTREPPPSRDLTEFDRLRLDLELERLSLASCFVWRGTELRR